MMAKFCFCLIVVLVALVGQIYCDAQGDDLRAKLDDSKDGSELVDVLYAISSYCDRNGNWFDSKSIAYTASELKKERISSETARKHVESLFDGCSREAHYLRLHSSDD
ncbi:uncharacterized protein LOC141855908 [Brevipalpus obovatus]|uniref:uncharacterized protein LOC141855908 n=1 Tax=Brevipalpus obovatus TaxID=246614 RepID=UPI003D9F1923